jgi:glucose/arabinose dehydrogenase
MRLLSLLALLCFSFLLKAQVSLELLDFASGFSLPVDLVHAGDERLFVVEKGGLIKVIDGDGNVLPDPFLDIDSKVNSFASERGLLGLAFHPDYANNGYFYVNYTNNSGDTRISRFSVTADPNKADVDSELVLMTIEQPFSNHNGGCLRFGPDGYLYIGTGDGGSGGDPIDAGQDRQNLLGKILRIDVDNGSPYSIPADNPFADDDFTLDEIWALGMRNPWRFSFDRSTGNLWIADVGQNDWEEIDFELADSPGGLNYGWRCFEGFENFNLSGCENVNDMIPPVHAYANTNSVGCSVTGGYVYRGSLYPEVYGWYIYGDFCSGRIWALYPDAEDGWINIELINTTNSEIAGFAEDANGELYMVGIASGKLFRLGFSCDTPATPEIEGAQAICNPGEAVALSLDQVPDGYAINWYLDGEIIAGVHSSTLNLTEPGVVSAQLFAGESSCVPEAANDFEVVLASFPDELIVTASETEIQAVAGYDFYQWYLNGALIDGATSSTYTIQEFGAYTVIVTDENGCSRESEEVVIINQTEDLLQLKAIKIQPNPFSDRLAVFLEVEKNGTYQFRLLDASGKVVWSTHMAINTKLEHTFSFNQLETGTYVFDVSFEGQHYALPLVKQ